MINTKGAYRKIGEFRSHGLMVLVIAIGLYFFLESFLLEILTSMKNKGYYVYTEREPLKVSIFLIIILILHELSHYLAYWKLCGISTSHIAFGFQWRWFIPYCFSKVPVSVSCHRTMLIIPLFVTGSIAILGLCIFPSNWIIKVVSTSISICMYDLYDFFRLRKFSIDCIIVGSSNNKFGAIEVYKLQDENGPKRFNTRNE